MMATMTSSVVLVIDRSRPIARNLLSAPDPARVGVAAASRPDACDR
jgi:hypothetical protein